MNPGTAHRPPVADLAAKLLETRDRRDALKATLGAVDLEVAAAESELATAMTAAGLRSFEHRGRALVPRLRETWSSRPGRQAEVVAILKAHIPSIVRETVHPATLNRFLGDRRAELATSSWWASLEPCLTRTERAFIAVCSRTNAR